ncbi:hypothetical protein CDAR_292791 [Caerostris darwini]|uniref:Uncharacterized protein n=1 Tax=Caerostris darwini TaxID=1538125 RepID=A0AAV4SAA5_9ARAC|nr:hypothetical protein CDAR_292791 [Caerostris darwini]
MRKEEAIASQCSVAGAGLESETDSTGILIYNLIEVKIDDSNHQKAKKSIQLIEIMRFEYILIKICSILRTYAESMELFARCACANSNCVTVQRGAEESKTDSPGILISNLI